MNPLSRDEARLLAEVSFLAARRGALDDAQTILDALRLCRPESAMPLTGLACVMLSRGMNDEACSLLDKAVALAGGDDGDGDTVNIQAIRAMALQQAGRALECDRAVKALGSHPLAQALAAQAAPINTSAELT